MPVVDFQSALWAQPNPDRVILSRPVWAHYGKTDLEKAHQFALDFGFTETARASNPERIYYKGYNDQPVAYILEKTAQPLYFGSAMEAATEADLHRAAKLPGASPVRDLEFPGGGQIVTIRDPDNIPFHVVYNYTTVPVSQPPKTADVYNTAQRFDDEKPRRGRFQRIAKGPSPIFKLGHFGHISPDIGKISTWYMQHFNIRALDVQAHMHDATQDFAVFYNLELGQHYSDHHAFFHFQQMPMQKYPGPHHASFEVHDFDVQLQGHYHLESQKYELMWGVGRHLLGSQIFDYWYDTEGFILEHYTDGDVVNEDNKPSRLALSRDEYTSWGADFNNVHGGYTGDPRPPLGAEVVTAAGH